jgi:chemotaxis protein MotB
MVFHDPAFDAGYLDEGEPADDPLQGLPANQWAVQWGDLMMTMFVFFAMLYAYRLSERDAGEGFRSNQTAETVHERTIEKVPVDTPVNTPTPMDPKSAGLTPEQILELSEQAAKETNISDVEIVLQDDNTIKISLRGPLLFDTGSAELRGETVGFLHQVALVLGKTNNEVHVVGHTDNFPIHSEKFPTNWELSVARASRVARHLIEQGSLDPGRFTVMGHALYRPVEPNTNPESKQRNRRVEIIITRIVYTAPPNMY